MYTLASNCRRLPTVSQLHNTPPAKNNHKLFASVLFGGTVAWTLWTYSKNCKPEEPAPIDAKMIKINELQNRWKMIDRNSAPSPDVLLARANEIKKELSDDYFLFLHGQSSAYVPILFLTNQIAIKNGLAKPYGFEFMRYPLPSDEQRQKHLENIALVQNMRHKDNDPTSQKGGLISVDGNWNSKQHAESAYYFFHANHNIHPPSSADIKEILSNDKSLTLFHQEIVGELVVQFCNSPYLQAESGSLYVICVPKHQAELPPQIFYRAHMFGTLCNCHPKRHDLEVLEDLQNGIFNRTTHCRDNYSPQYRLNAQELTNENGVKIFALLPFSTQKLERIESEIQHLSEPWGWLE